MDFKKCLRCGCFFLSNDNVCCHCMPKDHFEISKLENYFNDTNTIESMEDVSIHTGISLQNINRYMDTNEDLKKWISLN